MMLLVFIDEVLLSTGWSPAELVDYSAGNQ
jgi:hypothetical protein